MCVCVCVCVKISWQILREVCQTSVTCLQCVLVRNTLTLCKQHTKHDSFSLWKFNMKEIASCLQTSSNSTNNVKRKNIPNMHLYVMLKDKLARIKHIVLLCPILIENVFTSFHFHLSIVKSFRHLHYKNPTSNYSNKYNKYKTDVLLSNSIKIS